MDLVIRRGERTDLEQLVPLMDAYRQFYRQRADMRRAREFLAERLAKGESVVLLAMDRDQHKRGVGFIQLFPSFDSVDLAQIWILHDLFVASDYRERGVGRRLMLAAEQFCRATRGARIDLATAADNSRAQGLYQALGYQREEGFYRYSLSL